MKLSNVKISHRLALGFGALAALLVGTTVQSLISAATEESATSRVDRSLDVAHDAMQVKFRSADLNGWQTAYAFDVTNGARNATSDTVGSRKAFLESAASLRAELATLAAHGLDDTERKTFDQAEAAFDTFMTIDAKVIGLYRVGDPASVKAANDLVLGEEIAAFETMSKAIDALITNVDANAADATKASHDAVSTARAVAIAIGVLAVALAAGLARVITRSIAGPLGRLRDRLVQIADGDGDLTQRLDDDRRDELGAVAAAFNRFVTKIANTVRTIGDHSVVIASASEELSAVSKQMAGNAQLTLQQARNSSSASGEVSANVQTVAAATEEMTAAIAEIARGATDAATVAARARELADNAQTTMSRLDQSSLQIDEVARLIGGIAAQTNLLALNATIEAARAGETGKGCAVVATEVKDLANRSGGATTDISRQIVGIQNDVHAAVTSIDDIVNVIDQINEAFAAIATAVEEQTATTTEISRSLVQVSDGAAVIANDVTDVARTAGEATDGAANTEQAAVELAHLAGELQALVGTFKV